VIALLVDHLARRGRIRRGVAIGAATGSLVEKVARAHGLHVERHPIGFKALSGALCAGRADAAGEESGGFALSEMGPDKDGILAGALLVELVAATGLPLEAHVERLEQRFGTSACGRIARPRSAAIDRALVRLASDPPDRVGRVRVLAVDACDGVRLALADGGFLMFRRSGTERLARVYAEAGDPQRLARRLREGTLLLERAGR
jgi:phosphomannomutase